MSAGTSDPPLWRALIGPMAHHISALYFGSPVYLVGGAQTQDDPRDLDIVVVLTDPVFVACYGDRPAAWLPERTEAAVKAWIDEHVGSRIGAPSRLWERWAVDCAKHSLQLTMALHRRVDLKTQPESYAEPKQEHGRTLLARIRA